MGISDYQQKNNFLYQKRRTNIELMADILQNAKNGGNKENLMEKTHLNVHLIDIFLAYLSSKSLIESNNGIYKTTSKGLEAIDRYCEFCNLL
jgi:predicted transcriptional regulator